MPSYLRPCLSILTTALLLVPSTLALDSPLSDEAVREAYFLGQRHDASFLSKYIKFLPPPKTGPHISSITFLTPFAQLAQLSDRRIGNYSAQQARLDHLGDEEFVIITVEIYLTDSYGPLVASPTGARPDSSTILIPRPYYFWKDFRVHVYDGNQIVSPSVSGGHPLYRCGRRGPCPPMGAALELEFRAGTFTSDSATIQVLPPEGPEVSVSFDLSRLR